MIVITPEQFDLFIKGAMWGFIAGVVLCVAIIVLYEILGD